MKAHEFSRKLLLLFAGHTRSWGQAYPKLLSECFDSEGPDGSLGPMNPIAPETYEFMKKFLKEISEIFPDSYIHLGGDEVDFQCWSVFFFF